jgi:ubiquinone/menaquinone biosynthesis C-methylase UbiE
MPESRFNRKRKRATGPEVGSFFDDRVEWYDARYDRRDADGHALRARMATVLQLLEPEPPGQVLDAGMGPGRLCAELERRRWTVSGVDVSEEMVATARRRLPGASERLLVARVEELPFDDATFDAVVATGALEYSDVGRALAELARVLRPAGAAVVTYPNPHAVYAITKTRVYYPAVRAVKRLLGRPGIELPRGAPIVPPGPFQQLLVAAGLEPGAVAYTSFLPVPAPLDLVLPRLAAALGERLEGSGRPLGALFATQVVFAARKA